MGRIFKENWLWPHLVATKVNAIKSSGSTVKPALGVVKNSLSSQTQAISDICLVFKLRQGSGSQLHGNK